MSSDDSSVVKKCKYQKSRNSSSNLEASSITQIDIMARKIPAYVLGVLVFAGGQCLLLTIFHQLKGLPLLSRPSYDANINMTLSYIEDITVKGSSGGQQQLQKSISSPQEAAIQPENQQLQELTFDDLHIGEYLDRGSVNIVAKVKLPTWWYEQQKEQQEGNFYINESTELVIKIAVYANEGDLEIEALRILNSDKALAAKHNILPLVWSRKSFDNPYYIKKGGMILREFPESWPDRAQEKMRNEKTIAALVVPNLETAGKMYEVREVYELHGPQGLRRFMRSLLLTLDYAHGVGVNNYDLYHTNVFSDEKGNAVVADWNFMHAQGQNVFEPEANFAIVPPEAILEEVPVPTDDAGGISMKQVKQTSIGSHDVWSVGVMFANQLFQPCVWIRHSHFGGRGGDLRPYLREIIQSIGGNTKIRVNSDGDESDVGAVVGLDYNEIAQISFKVPLCENHRGKCSPCKSDNFPVLSSFNETKALAYDLLKRMMVLAPQDRPSPAELLKHPFFHNE